MTRKAVPVRVCVSGAARLAATLGVLLVLPPHAQAAPAPEQAEAGKALFTANCKMCHGEEGVGGRAPTLRGNKFTAPFVRKTAEEGRPGTMMPTFTPRLSGGQFESLAIYVASLQPLPAVPSGDAGKGTLSASAGGAVAPRPPDPVLTGDPMAGRGLFFNRAVLDSCHVCHTFDGQGGRAGPNLTSRMNGRSAREIFHRIVVVPHRSVDPAYVRVRVTTKSGAKYVGIRAESGSGSGSAEFHFYDTASLPPVLRAIPKADVVSVVPVTGSPMPSDYATRLSLKQLLDLVAFLKAGTAPVSLADVLDIGGRSGG